MNERVAVMLSEAGPENPVAEDLARHDVRVSCYTDLAELFGANAPDAIPVLIFHLRERPWGRVLEVVGRMAIEYPRVQMMAVSEVPLSLEVVEYLAGRGVDVVRMGPDSVEAEALPAVVERLHERRQRSLAAC